MIWRLKAFFFCRNGHAPVPMGLIGSAVGSERCMKCGGPSY